MRNRISASEYASWIDHFNKNPPLEAVVPLMLAQLIDLVAKGLGVEGSSIYNYAPWLKSKADKKSAKTDTSYIQALTEGVVKMRG